MYQKIMDTYNQKACDEVIKFCESSIKGLSAESREITAEMRSAKNKGLFTPNLNYLGENRVVDIADEIWLYEHVLSEIRKLKECVTIV